jgi:putative Holliday junction resolvase
VPWNNGNEMLEVSIPASIEYLPLVDTVCQAFCLWAGIARETADEIAMAAVEGATNAVVHGNKCRRSKKVRIFFEKTRCEIIVSVADEGEGFDPDNIPDPTEESNLLKESGRGIFIMRQFMDRVEFERPEGGGTLVRMAKTIPCENGGRILCVDYGHKRLGLALSDEMCLTAQPLGKIEEEDEEGQIKAVAKAAEENKVSEIVVGLPLTMKGDVSTSASRVIAFARELNKRLCIPIVTWDERLSTKESEQILIRSGMRRADRKGVVDSVAAAVILQSYLDARSKK